MIPLILTRQPNNAFFQPITTLLLESRLYTGLNPQTPSTLHTFQSTDRDTSAALKIYEIVADFI